MLIALLAGILLLPADRQATAGELIISAAASLTNVMRELGEDFEKANPGVKIIFNYGASGSLLQQIANGAPVDVFAPAGRKDMDKAEALGLLAATSRRDFAANRLVLAVPADGRANLHSLADLTRPEVKRIGLGSPESVPAGRYAKAVLNGAGLWEQLAGKFIYGNSVRQVLDYLSRGEVDAGLVYGSDALLKSDSVKVIAELQVTGGIIYPVAQVNESKNPGEAVRFLNFLLTPKAQALLGRHGFEPPKR
ncbi:MAG TPA: molybdate ABC transporter substrate-binding protein [Desulfurivibrionaceae bacterium]|nr:molybdate ABC transporter substrate-binding protein [Desulfurivibrionaceae bacterium]